MSAESAAAAPAAPQILRLGRVGYLDSLARMRRFTDARDAATRDEIWLLEHEPVFTQGQAGKAEHLLAPGEIAIVQSDRGGQVTYHGPGQLVVYVLADLHRLGYGIRSLVTRLEQSVIALLERHGIRAYADPAAPGVYVDAADGTRMKIASLGLRVRRGCTYHGLALNVAMDLAPFARINPCGYQGLQVTQLSELSAAFSDHSCAVKNAADQLLPLLLAQLGYPAG